MKKFFPILIMIAAVAGGLWLGTIFQDRDTGTRNSAPSMRSISQHTMALDPPKTVQPFQLIDHHNKPFTLDSLKQKWTLMFFGYTHCPDVCPTTMQVLADVDERLAKNEADLHKDTRVVFVSVDPKRDNTEQLAKYVPYFNRSFLGVTGGPDQIDQLTRQLGIMHLQVKQGEGYLVDHSASILLFGPDAKLHGIFSAPHATDRLLQDYIKLRRTS
jgi:protein SCO1/2